MEENILPEEQPEAPKKSGGKVAMIIAAIIIVILGAIWFLKNNSKEKSPAPKSEVQSQPNSGAAGNAEETAIKSFDVSGKPFEFSIKEIKVKKGDRVKINFTSAEGLHDWVIDEFGAKTKQLSAGQNESVEFVADKTGTFEYYCSVGNHRKMGMVGKLIVE